MLLPLFLLLVVAITSVFWRLGENFHAVIPGCVYRSGQLSPPALARRAASNGIRSVINLRGSNPGHLWYERECAEARRQGLKYYDLPVDSQCLTAEELKELLQVLALCPKPVLIHCYSGIDRSGIVAAICVLLLDESGSLDRARAHLSWRYGHMPWRENMAAQERFLQDYQTWLEQRGQAHDPGRFREWLVLVSEEGDARNALRCGP